MPSDLLKSLLHLHNARGSRSTAVNPLAWVLASFLAAFVLGSGGPMWMSYLLASLLVLVVTAFLIAYFYCLLKNPDALRSEKFTLSKMQLERSLKRDTIGIERPAQTGLGPPAVIDAPKFLDRNPS